MDALLQPGVMEGLDAAPSSGQQFETRLAYDFPAFADRLTLTPALALALSSDNGTLRSLLWHWRHPSRPGGNRGNSPWRGSARNMSPPHAIIRNKDLGNKTHFSCGQSKISVGWMHHQFPAKRRLAILMQHTEQQTERWDAVEHYFICISECSLHDGECVTHCVEMLKTEQADSG
ncbi:MAG: hypothetical protein F4Z73_07840 [Synechococcus sp. SB0668_bin_13]|nr:hypothetical protein [Synechococcus sp. SB0668_bin_13]